jgi:Kef-type K+ transport system membrane component KefB
MDLSQQVVLDFFVILVAAKVGGCIVARWRQPQVLGELVAGVVIGPHALGLIGDPGPALTARLGSEGAARAALEGAYRSIAELGLIFLLFFVGLETRVREVVKVGRRAAVIGVRGVLVPFALGYIYMRIDTRPDIEALFVGAALVATTTVSLLGPCVTLVSSTTC